MGIDESRDDRLAGSLEDGGAGRDRRAVFGTDRDDLALVNDQGAALDRGGADWENSRASVSDRLFVFGGTIGRWADCQSEQAAKGADQDPAHKSSPKKKADRSADYGPHSQRMG